MIWGAYFVFVAALIVLAVIDQPILIIGIPAGLVGCYGLMWLITKLVNPPWRPPPRRK